MNGKNENMNVIEMLRDKTEEADLKSILKSSFGGYTKKSVQEYIGVLRKQQQSTQETFQKTLQDLFEEKESIKKSNESLLVRYNKLSAEYDNLAESLKSIKLDNKVFSANDIFSLKATIVSDQEEIKVLQGEKKSLEKKVAQLDQNIEELKKSLKLSYDETEAQKEMLKAEKMESKKQRDMVADLSRQLHEEKNEVKFLRATLSDGKFHDLNAKVNELNVQLSAQTEVISKLNYESALKDKTIETLNDEIVSLKQRLSSMIQNVQSLNIQNDKLLVSNDLLKTQLEQEYKRSINLINEKANCHVDKLIAQKNLSTAEAKLIALELKANNRIRVEELQNITVLAEDSE